VDRDGGAFEVVGADGQIRAAATLPDDRGSDAHQKCEDGKHNDHLNQGKTFLLPVARFFSHGSHLPFTNQRQEAASLLALCFTNDVRHSPSCLTDAGIIRSYAVSLHDHNTLGSLLLRSPRYSQAIFPSNSFFTAITFLPKLWAGGSAVKKQPESVGERIQRLRKKAGLTQERLGELTDLHHSYIRLYAK
jgi:hypothetical protein